MEERGGEPVLGQHKRGAGAGKDQGLQVAFIQATAAAIKTDVRGGILGDPFPNGKVHLKVHSHEA